MSQNLSEQEYPHVHFQEDSNELKSNEIVVKRKSGNKLEIQLGFLQINHVYEINVSMGRTLFPQNCEICNFTQLDDPVPNINCRVTNISENEEQTTIRLSIRFSAVKEKLAREKFSLVDTGDRGIRVDIEAVARVLGKGKGTPMLREGVTCVKTLTHLDTETETDWLDFNEEV